MDRVVTKMELVQRYNYKVPMGTVVTNASTGEVIADLVKDEEKLLFLAEEAEEEIKPLLLMKTKPQ